MREKCGGKYGRKCGRKCGRNAGEMREKMQGALCQHASNTGFRVNLTGTNNESARENFIKHFVEITDFQNRDKLLRMRIIECLMMNAWSELSESSERNEAVIAEIEKTSEIICVEGYCVSSFMRLWSSYDHSAQLFRMSPYGKTTVPMSTVFGYFTTEYGMEYAEQHMKNTINF